MPRFIALLLILHVALLVVRVNETDTFEGDDENEDYVDFDDTNIDDI